jgi:hypothetical protein
MYWKLWAAKQSCVSDPKDSRMKRNPMRRAVPALLVVLTLTLVGFAGDTSMLKPPKGSKVALILF